MTQIKLNNNIPQDEQTPGYGKQPSDPATRQNEELKDEDAETEDEIEFEDDTNEQE